MRRGGEGVGGGDEDMLIFIDITWVVERVETKLY